MTKIAYPILAMEVERLYQVQFDENDMEAIEKHIDFIATFIRSAGWDEEEYLDRWLQEQNGQQTN